MSRLQSSRSRPKPNRVLARSRIADTVLLVGLLAGISCSLPSRPAVRRYSNSINTPTVTDVDLQRYVRAAIAIEQTRQTAYKEVQQQGGEVASINCYQPQRLTTLNENVRAIAMHYCTQARGIVQRSGLTVAQFNRITSEQQADLELANRIQSILRSAP